MTACYLTQSIPSLLDMIAKYLPGRDVWKALLANANVGGESVHRGSLFGAILGARTGDSALPAHLKDGLFHRGDLEKEIDDFVKTVLDENGGKQGEAEEVIEL
jgi:ADP-ribosylglycohydrolase